jgi:phosphoribosyl-ATP pyrophosphohydrolase
VNALINLYETILMRKTADSATSYTARLFQAGEDEIVKKIGEEAVEVILAAKGQGKTRLIEEISDLVYHTLVLMAEKDIPPDLIVEELEKRRK